jgi:hypothetical protein
MKPYMRLFEIIREYSSKSIEPDPIAVLAWVQLFHSGLGIFLCLTSFFDGTLQNASRSEAGGFVFFALMIGFVFAWVGIICGYGLSKQQTWAWVGTLILQGLNLLGGLFGLLDCFLSVARAVSQPLQPSNASGIPILLLQIILSVTILQWLFLYKAVFFKSNRQ